MTAPKALIYGGKGALGSALISFLKAKNWVCILAINYISIL